ncbi:MAG: hypothetical protein L3J41_01360 [Melioribacteraceae bacterium]|nr:hypothetical protein [Melioribacteraceae bacterium]
MKQYNFLTIILFLVIVTPLFSQSTSKVFFTRFDQYSGRVYSDGLGGGSPTILVNNIDRPANVAIDWSVSPHKMYVAINGGNKITRYDIDGTNPVDILTGQTSVNDIELDLTIVHFI